MNQIDWQMLTALLFVAIAVCFLVRRILRFFKQRPGCGSCTGCAPKTENSASFVSLDQLKHSK